MIHTRATYWRSLALSTVERARYFAAGLIALRAPDPTPVSDRVAAVARVDAAVAEYRALSNRRRGNLKAIAEKHGTRSQSIIARLKREEAAEIECQRTLPVKREFLLVCDVTGNGQKNSNDFGPKRRSA